MSSTKWRKTAARELEPASQLLRLSHCIYINTSLVMLVLPSLGINRRYLRALKVLSV